MIFELGNLTITPAAQAALVESGEQPSHFIKLHSWLDRGELDDNDYRANQEAVRGFERIFSVYKTSLGVRLYVITEADRSVTTILLPEDY
jgi:hypothetical protein